VCFWSPLALTKVNKYRSPPGLGYVRIRRQAKTVPRKSILCFRGMETPRAISYLASDRVACSARFYDDNLKMTGYSHLTDYALQFWRVGKRTADLHLGLFDGGLRKMWKEESPNLTRQSLDVERHPQLQQSRGHLYTEKVVGDISVISRFVRVIL
jgi:hypothetical protein